MTNYIFCLLKAEQNQHTAYFSHFETCVSMLFILSVCTLAFNCLGTYIVCFCYRKELHVLHNHYQCSDDTLMKFKAALKCKRSNMITVKYLDDRVMISKLLSIIFVYSNSIIQFHLRDLKKYCITKLFTVYYVLKNCCVT